MAENEAIDIVAKELSIGNPLYAFKPEDVEEKFFIGEAIITAAATIFIAAFAKGINTALEKKGQELGETVGNWFVGKLEGLFRKPKDAKSEEDKLKKDIKELSQFGSKLDKKTRDARLDATEEVVTQKLKERGVSSKKAEEIAKKGRIGAETLISQEVKHGSK